MKCANPNCSNTKLYLRGGVLRLLALEAPLEPCTNGHHVGNNSSQPAARYFWLCSACARFLVVKRWTAEGLILESHDLSDESAARTWVVHAVPAVEPKSIFHFQRPPFRAA